MDERFGNKTVRHLKGAPLAVVMLLVMRGGGPCDEKFLRCWSGYSYHSVSEALEYLSSQEMQWVVYAAGGWRLSAQCPAVAEMLALFAQMAQTSFAGQAAPSGQGAPSSGRGADARHAEAGASEAGGALQSAGLDGSSLPGEMSRKSRDSVVVDVVESRLNLENNNNRGWRDAGLENGSGLALQEAAPFATCQAQAGEERDDREIWAALASAGVYRNPRTEHLVRQPHMTAEYIAAHLAVFDPHPGVRSRAGLLVSILESGAPPPQADALPPARDGAPRSAADWGLPDAWEADEAEQPVDPKVQHIWEMLRGQLQFEMPRAMYDSYVRNLQPMGFDGKAFLLACRNAYSQAWLESRLSTLAGRLLEGICQLDGAAARFVVC